MRSLIIVVGLVVFATFGSAQDCESYRLSGTSPSTKLSITAINQILDEHNRARRSVFPWAKTMPMLQWDQKLADHIQSYMDTCPHGSGLSHSSSSYRQDQDATGYSYVGENLAAGSSSSYLPENEGGFRSSKAWNDEIVDYTYSKIGADGECTTGKACGHYTQNIWASSTHIGCGYTRCDSLRFKNYWGCVYGPGGNYRNQFPYESTTVESEVASCQYLNSSAVTTPAPTPAPPSPTPGPEEEEGSGAAFHSFIAVFCVFALVIVF